MYSPLNPDCREIRVALLEPAVDFPSVIRVRLVPISLDKTPVRPYDALSYVWGNAEVTSPVFLDGAETSVTTNLESALRSLRFQDKERTLWIDALCINQRDIVERNQQIMHMKDVYSFANTVIVWLGDPGPNTGIALNFISKHVHLDRGVINDEWLLKTLKEPNALLAFRTIGEDILKRKWWKRIWVIQEIARAHRQPTVKSGPFECEWDQLVAALVFADRNHIATNQFTFQELAVGAFHAPYKEMSMLRRKQFLGEPTFLIDLLQSCFRCEATDKRDHIFALTGLVSDHDNDDLIRPDYSKPWQTVYRDLTRFLIKRDKKLNIICAANHAGLREILPSWVSDWSDNSQTSNLITSFSSEDKKYGRYWCAASGECIADAEFSDNSNTLFVSGFGDDAVEVVGEIMSSVLDLDRVVVHWLRIIFGDADPSNEYPYVGGGGMLEAFNRTICVDKDFYGHRANPGSCGIVFDIKFVPKHHHEHVDDDEERVRRLISDQKGAVGHVAPRRCFFYTKAGYMGLGPPGTKVGDRLKILKGCDVPVLLRPVGEHHILVGETHVCGIMDGEMMAALKGGKFQLERFSIR